MTKNKIVYIKRTLAVFWWIALILLVFVLIRVVGAKMRGQVPTVLGYSVVNIISGSMEDTIPEGTYILIKKVDASSVKKDDIICFYSTDTSIYGMLNTHRVIEDPIKTDTGIEFVTKGDANSAKDKVNASGDRLVGVYVKKLDSLTAFSNLLSGNTLFIVIFGLQLAIITIVVYGMVKSKAQKKDSDGQEPR